MCEIVTLIYSLLYCTLLRNITCAILNKNVSPKSYSIKRTSEFGYQIPYVDNLSEYIKQLNVNSKKNTFSNHDNEQNSETAFMNDNINQFQEFNKYEPKRPNYYKNIEEKYLNHQFEKQSPNDPIIPNIYNEVGGNHYDNQYNKNNKYDVNSNDLVKEKLISFVNDSKTNFKDHYKRLRIIHDQLNKFYLYKIGYIISYIKKSYADVNDIFKQIQENNPEWDVIRLLKAYEQVKNRTDYLSNLHRLLEQALGGKVEKLILALNARAQNKPNTPSNDYIAWSYYDEDTFG